MGNAGFSDRPYEDPGTRQRRWLDYLSSHFYDCKPIPVCVEYERKRYGRRETNESCVCPIDHRAILPGEQVIEFDTDARDAAVNITLFLAGYLRNRGYLVWLQDHGGRSPHLHVLGQGRPVDMAANPILRRAGLDRLKYNGSGLCREIGGTYRHKDGRRSFTSAVNTAGNPETITNPNRVEYPKWPTQN